MTISRRELLAGAGAVAVTAPLPGHAALAQTAPADEAATTRILAEIAESLLVEYPENATSLGLDKGARAGLKLRLTDRSRAGDRRRAATAGVRLARLKAVDRRRLTSATALDVDVVEAAHELAIDGYRFPFGDVAILNAEVS